ncbi:unnamed protein product [Lactuca virosa]|uniref:Uncharacterized protein n=1 Tax=Lactuca virosa TaxID=75947 RepID=A0AAU9MF19_9ASTR|nr:unnamed protein product [Lactuca virosa]
MMRKTTFKGANVFISRNLVPPEIFDSLHDVLKDNGAEIFLCCDPSRNGPDDYHVIAARDHEKLDDLRQKGCNLLGMAVSLPFQVLNVFFRVQKSIENCQNKDSLVALRWMESRYWHLALKWRERMRLTS